MLGHTDKRCLLFQIKNDYGLSFDDREKNKLWKACRPIDYKFLDYIKKELIAKEIICSRIQIEGNICYGRNCSFLGHSVGILWYTTYFLSSGSNLFAAMQCWNYHPRWKRFFIKYKSNELYSGEFLDKFIPIVYEIIEKNPDIYNINWVSKHELTEVIGERITREK